MKINRRDFMANVIAAGLLAGNPLYLQKMAQAGTLPSGMKSSNRRVVLFELFGGNDNLNTLVPYRDELYRGYRKDIALEAHEYITLNDELAFNDALLPLMDAWEKGELAVVQDVGYPVPNKSHFASINFIETGSSGQTTNTKGWVADALTKNPSLRDRKLRDLDVVWIGGHPDSMSGSQDICLFGPAGEELNIYADKYIAGPVAKAMSRDCCETNPYQMSINSAVSQCALLSTKVAERIHEKSRFSKWFQTYNEPDRLVSQQFEEALRFIESGIDTPIFKLGMSGFDLHASLRGAHETVLTRVASNLAKFRKALIEMDEWDNTLILVFSEFGRRPANNASLGTDHGTSYPMFVLGGQIGGGIYGERAALEDLDPDGNLKFKTDYRKVYSSIIENWWRVDVNPFRKAGYEPLPKLV